MAVDATEVRRDSTFATRFGALPLADFATERDPFLEANLAALAFSLIDLRAGEGLFAAFFVALGFAFVFAMRRPEL